MTDTLGVHVDEAGITAVRHDASDGGPPQVIQLGESGPAAACAVAQGEGGAVLVGEAALRAEGPRITDPLGRAGAGRIGALVAVLNHVVGRATTATGSAPERLAVVVPDDFDGAARDRIVQAGVGAGVADTVVVPVGVASAQPVTVDAVAAVAAGGARAGSLAAAPLVTREDLGESVEPRPQVTRPVSDPGAEPVSVFEPGDRPEPVRPSPAPIPARPASPPTQVVPRVAPVPEPLRYEPPSRRIPVGAWIAAALLGLIAAVGGALFFFGGDDSSGVDAAGTITVPDSTTTDVPGTTAAPTTTDPGATEGPDSTAPSTSSSSSTSSTSTTTSTSSTTTTTTPVAVGEPGPVTLVETGLQFDTSAVVRFDQDAEIVIEEVEAILGPPGDDTGYEPHAFCEGARSRFLRWGDLELVFTEDELDSEVGRFTQWFASGHDDPTGLVTRDGLGVTSTVGFLDVTYGAALAIVEAMEGETLGLFAVTNPGSGGVLNGTTTSLEPGGVVLDLWAGDSCTRVFT